MNAQFYADLEKVIQGWMDAHCEDDEWPNTIIGDKTVQLMANAARSVFDAVEDVQVYGLREGFFKEE